MSDNLQGQDSTSTLIEKYREVVLAYEKITKEIAALLEANDGGTVKMSDEDYLLYRDMAHRRDVLYDMLKRLEVRLLGEDAG
ncbi:MAG: hypothetical protein HPY64_14385 [Anaerolineae bacterium]|nr:hypothetical protein [Anaerolineae bacterium]